MALRTIDTVVFDVDDVLVDTDEATREGERAVEAPLARRVGAERAARARRAFTEGYATLIEQLRQPPGVRTPAYAALRPRIEAWQRGVTEAGHEVKQWSRESLLAIALEDAGVEPSRDALDEAAGAYWRTLAERTRTFEDARELCAALAARGVAFHAATNSDGFLRFDAARRTFVYEPAYSAERKVARLPMLAALGFARDRITVGDPHGKPSPLYYRRVLEELRARLGAAFEPSRTLVVGDSLTADVLPFLEAGVGRGAWLVRSEDARDGRGVPVVRSLLELLPLLGAGA